MIIEGAFLRSRVARRIVALFVLSALLPIGTLAFFVFAHVKDLLIEQGHAQLAHLAENYGSSVYERLLASDYQLRTTAVIYKPGTKLPVQVEERLRRLFVGMVVRYPDGRTEAVLDSIAHAPAYPTSRGWVETVVFGMQEGTSASHVFLMRPLQAGVANGPILVAEARDEFLWGRAGTFPAATDFCVIGDAGAVLFCTLPTIPSAIQEFARQGHQVASGRMTFKTGGQVDLVSYRDVFMAARFLVHGWTIVAMRPEEAALAPITAFRNIFIPAIVLALLLVALLSLNQVRRTLVPLERLIDGTRRAANKDFSARVEVIEDDEFGELAASFNSMAARLGTQFTALMTLADIDRAILSRLDVDRVLETAVTRMREIVPADQVSIAVLDRNASDMLRIYTRDDRENGLVAIDRSSCSDEDKRELLAHMDGLWLDASTTARSYTGPLARLGSVAFFVLPIVWKEDAVGAVVLGFRQRASLTDEERSRARDLGDRVGVAFATAAKDEQLFYQAHYDALTQLPNRLYFKDQLARRLVTAQRDRKRFALLFIDLDHFKNVNDSCGHAEGDEVLRQAAERLRGCVRESDSVARLGGDEFTIILSEMKAARDAEVVAQTVIRAMSVPFRVGGQEHFLNASIGIAVYPADGITVDELLRNADTAMYRAKDGGRGRAVYFEERMNAAAQARVTFARDMRHAIESEQFVLYYQPQLDLASGTISGVEALVRWNHPERGLLSPLHFIQLAEDTGLIEQLGEWVLREACRQYADWRRRGITLPRVAVNVSARQFRQKTFLPTVLDALRSSGMAPECLELEITETLLMDATREVESTLTKLDALGIRLALDDFGTGYSSLAYLKRFPVDVVKIDRSFVKDLPGDESSCAIIAAIIAMSHALHKSVLAEGVAEPEQLVYLRRLGCDMIQGFDLSRPLCATDLEVFMRTAAAAPTAQAA